MASWIPLVSAMIAALAAVAGYALNANNVRRDRKAKFYAEALLAVKEFEELPYRLAKRADSSPDTQERLGRLVSDAYVKISFYQVWLRIDSPRVGAAYDNLVRRASRIGSKQHIHAWSSPVSPIDETTELYSRYYYGTRKEVEICVAVMRREMRLAPFLYARQTKRMIANHFAMREKSGESIGELKEGTDYFSAIKSSQPPPASTEPPQSSEMS